VTYNIGSPPSYFYGDGFDTIQVFQTYVQSAADLDLAIIVGGDDGHSLFVDQAFVGGGGYGDAGVKYTLHLQANILVLVDLVGYNGPGNWVFSIRQQDTDNLIDEVSGVRISADGTFGTVPEPASLCIWGGIGICGLVAGWRRRRSQALAA
jgi:hypothetical protein